MDIIKFTTHECGNSPIHAFYRAVELAQANHSSSDGTGTIADRQGSKLMMFKPNRSKDPIEMLEDYFTTTIKTQDDPVGCIDLKDGEFLFFGWSVRESEKFINPAH